MKIIFPTVFSLAFLSGCSSIPHPQSPQRCTTELDVEKTFINYDIKPLVSRMVKGFCYPIKQYEIDSIMILDGVNLKTMKGSDLGVEIGINVKDQILNQCNTPVTKMTLTRYFRLSEKGVTATSFDLNELNKLNFPTPVVLVPSYYSNTNSLRINLELVDLSTQSTISSSNKLLKWQCQNSFKKKESLKVIEEV